MKVGVCPVIDTVSTKGFCVGCGFCAGTCPIGVLSMSLNLAGEYTPELKGDCTRCGKCLRVCPFGPDRIECTGLDDQTSLLGGDDLTVCGGHVVDETARRQRSSGGLLTELLCYLLEKKAINGAVVVGKNPIGGTSFFITHLARSNDEITGAAGSKYFPVQFADVLGEIRGFDGKVAFVGLPCHCTALKQTLQHDSDLREKISFIFGLTCGHQVTMAFTEFLASMTLVPLNEAESMSYRVKSPNVAACNFSFGIARSETESQYRLPFRASGFGQAWRRRLFTMNACEFCPDVFAEQADATFMDAWLPPYAEEPGGTSLVVARKESVPFALQGLVDDYRIKIWPMSAEDVIRSQEGVVKYKRTLLPTRVHHALVRNLPVPTFVRDCARSGNRREIRQIRRNERNIKIARTIWEYSWLPARGRSKLILALTSPLGGAGFRDIARKLLGRK